MANEKRIAITGRIKASLAGVVRHGNDRGPARAKLVVALRLDAVQLASWKGGGWRQHSEGYYEADLVYDGSCCELTSAFGAARGVGFVLAPQTTSVVARRARIRTTTGQRQVMPSLFREALLTHIIFAASLCCGARVTMTEQCEATSPSSSKSMPVLYVSHGECDERSVRLSRRERPGGTRRRERPDPHGGFSQVLIHPRALAPASRGWPLLLHEA